MVHTTSAITESTIVIEIENGAVVAVEGIPDGCRYEIVDHDVGCVEIDPEGEALYRSTVSVLVRAKSPDRAARAITNILDKYDMDDGTLIDWDYATQDGERQTPMCVNLDLEPENIAELLDHINNIRS